MQQYLSNPKETPFPQILVGSKSQQFSRNCETSSALPKESISLITSRRNKLLSVVSISKPKCMLAAGLPQYHKYLWLILDSMLLSNLFSSLSTLNFSSSSAFLPHLLIFLIKLIFLTCMLSLSSFSFCFPYEKVWSGNMFSLPLSISVLDSSRCHYLFSLSQIGTLLRHTMEGSCCQFTQYYSHLYSIKENTQAQTSSVTFPKSLNC